MSQLAKLLPIVALLLSACAAPPPVKDTLETRAIWKERQQQLNKLVNWSINGRIAITVGDEGWNASLRWKQQQQQYKLQIFAPLGQGTVSIEGDETAVVMHSTNSDIPPQIATNAEKLIYDQLGWHMPVDSLRHWVVGVPDPDIKLNQDAPDLDAEGRLIHLKQGGWDVNFLRYRQMENISLPEKIFIEKNNIRVRLVIQGWKLEG